MQNAFCTMLHSGVALRQLAEVERYNAKMYTVYALYNAESDKVYIGQSEDIEERLRAHHDKRFGRSFTARGNGTWILIYSEEVSSRSEALKREKQLKSFRGREFVRKHIPD